MRIPLALRALATAALLACDPYAGHPGAAEPRVLRIMASLPGNGAPTLADAPATASPETWRLADVPTWQTNLWLEFNESMDGATIQDPSTSDAADGGGGACRAAAGLSVTRDGAPATSAEVQVCYDPASPDPSAGGLMLVLPAATPKPAPGGGTFLELPPATTWRVAGMVRDLSGRALAVDASWTTAASETFP